MTTLYFVLQLISIAYLSTFGPVFLSTMARCVVHDRSYTIGYYDMIMGACVMCLVVLGLPKL